MLTMDGYDDCIIGTGHRFGQPSVDFSLVGRRSRYIAGEIDIKGKISWPC